MRFPGSFIFNDLQSSKMAVPPCTAHRPLKNAIFQWPAKLSRMRILVLTLILLLAKQGAAAPPAMLAKHYHSGIDLHAYWVSEKLDGVRAWWDGSRLLSRRGNAYPAPDWFTQNFPDTPLDGELWIDRQRFEETVGIVRAHNASDAAWRRIRFMVFDLPAAPGPFDQRLGKLRQLIAERGIPWLRAVEQFRVKNENNLMRRLRAVTDAGGEGLMLHRGASLYHTGRTDDLLKLKTLYDAEATVIGHILGKGKYRGLLGALLVATPDGKIFRIGTGLSDAERHKPPQIGSTITYRYRGLTRKGVPRFASFLRIREDF